VISPHPYLLISRQLDHLMNGPCPYVSVLQRPEIQGRENTEVMKGLLLINKKGMVMGCVVIRGSQSMRV
jgi:hypothetical protein